MRKFVNLLLVGVLFSSVAAYAANDTKEEKIIVGNRPFSHSEIVAHQERRAVQDQQEAQIDEKDEAKRTPCKACTDEVLVANTQKDQKQVNLANKIEVNLGAMISGKQLSTYYTSHPGAFHRPIAFGIFGETMELEDGSIWTIYSGHQYATLKWLTSDTIVVVPNSSWFSSYLFCLVNQNTGEAVEANLTVGPIYNGVYTHWVVSIDPFCQQLMLEDGSRWDLSSFDSSIFHKWLPNDTIIIGVNNGSFHYSYPNILINVNTLTHVKAKCFY